MLGAITAALRKKGNIRNLRQIQSKLKHLTRK
jgi:hypothetical protein